MVNGQCKTVLNSILNLINSYWILWKARYHESRQLPRIVINLEGCKSGERDIEDVRPVRGILTF